jgi:hypothetical protein
MLLNICSKYSLYFFDDLEVGVLGKGFVVTSGREMSFRGKLKRFPIFET